MVYAEMDRVVSEKKDTSFSQEIARYILKYLKSVRLQLDQFVSSEKKRDRGFVNRRKQQFHLRDVGAGMEFEKDQIGHLAEAVFAYMLIELKPFQDTVHYAPTTEIDDIRNSVDGIVEVGVSNENSDFVAGIFFVDITTSLDGKNLNKKLKVIRERLKNGVLFKVDYFNFPGAHAQQFDEYEPEHVSRAPNFVIHIPDKFVKRFLVNLHKIIYSSNKEESVALQDVFVEDFAIYFVANIEAQLKLYKKMIHRFAPEDRKEELLDIVSKETELLLKELKVRIRDEDFYNNALQKLESKFNLAFQHLGNVNDVN